MKWLSYKISHLTSSFSDQVVATEPGCYNGAGLLRSYSILKLLQSKPLFLEAIETESVHLHSLLFQLVDRVLLVFMPSKYQPDHMYLRHVPIKRVHLFTFMQIVCLVVLWVIKTIKSVSIVFPIMVSCFYFFIFSSYNIARVIL